jgi:capsular exopolysaccharide synthesis family protein
LPNPRQTEESDLSLIGQAIRRRLWLVVLCLVVATAAAVILTVTAEKQYSSTAALLLRTSTAVEPQRAVDTNLQLLSLPIVARRTAESVAGLSKEEVESLIETKQKAESDIIQVTATASSPERAAEVANAFAHSFIVFRERESGNGQHLQIGRVAIVELATPESAPVSPKPLRNIVFGMIVGLVLGLGLTILLEQLDRRLKRGDDLAEATDLPVLATVPKRKAFDREHLGHGTLSPAETEVFRLLRANLRYFKVRQDVKSVLVTSAESGEGKTLVSLGLALAAVTSGERVLLIEADLRDPGLSRVLGLPERGGLSELLSSVNAGAISGAVTTVSAGDLAEAVGDASLDVLHAGAIPPNPTELVESQKMKDVVVAAEGEYDLVVIDTPPVLVVSDAMPLISIVSGVLAVSGLGVSTRASASDLAQQLERIGAPTLGLVANFAENTGRSYEGYGYGRPPAVELMRPAAGGDKQPTQSPTASGEDQ